MCRQLAQLGGREPNSERNKSLFDGSLDSGGGPPVVATRDRSQDRAGVAAPLLLDLPGNTNPVRAAVPAAEAEAGRCPVGSGCRPRCAATA
jgi:hypothetical protein